MLHTRETRLTLVFSVSVSSLQTNLVLFICSRAYAESGMLSHVESCRHIIERTQSADGYSVCGELLVEEETTVICDVARTGFADFEWPGVYYRASPGWAILSSGRAISEQHALSVIT